MQEDKAPSAIWQIMLANDPFSHWLGLEVEACEKGYCRLHYRVREDMLNGFSYIHGGVLFSAADSAFAFACNSHGNLTVALDVSISFTRPARAGDLLTVEAKEVFLGNRVGIYEVRTTNEEGDLVTLFKGTAYRTAREFNQDEPSL